jgi:hypothetical protein
VSAPPAAPTSATWGACRYCSVAVPPGAKICPICGAADPISAAELPKVSKVQRRRLQATGIFRSFIVVAVCLGLGYSMISLVFQGAPTIPDPLTTSGYYTIAPGNYTLIEGEITGGDFVIGNFSTSNPVGLNMELEVFNSTQIPQFLDGLSPQPLYTLGPMVGGHIVFAAAYTDDYSFVFLNPYPLSSHLAYTAQITTEYESNVADDGFD